jgi:hypothetical protein
MSLGLGFVTWGGAGAGDRTCFPPEPPSLSPWLPNPAVLLTSGTVKVDINAAIEMQLTSCGHQGEGPIILGWDFCWGLQDTPLAPGVRQVAGLRDFSQVHKPFSNLRVRLESDRTLSLSPRETSKGHPTLESRRPGSCCAAVAGGCLVFALLWAWGGGQLRAWTAPASPCHLLSTAAQGSFARGVSLSHCVAKPPLWLTLSESSLCCS